MRWFRRAWPYVLLALLVAVNIAAWSQRQDIADWWRLKDYTPPAEIVALADDTTMTDHAKHLLYINHPSLENKENFNAHCSDKSQETAVLGCYHGDRQGIYIYAVTDERLQGVRQVTTAHEMLHQAYDRLSHDEKAEIDALLLKFFEHDLKNDDIRSKLESYKKQGDVVLVNEMHSIFGSEVRSLPAELETYYKKYFTDRSKVVNYSEAYQGEFKRRQDLVKSYDAQLASLKKQINANKATLEADMNFLTNKEKEISQDIANQDQAAYDQDVKAYNNMVETYNALLNSTRKLIDEHNNIVDKRNDIAVQEQQLQQALDSRLDSPTQKQ